MVHAYNLSSQEDQQLLASWTLMAHTCNPSYLGG
jgi:hypothetical protein